MRKPKTTARPPLRLIDCQEERRQSHQLETVSILRALTARALRGEVLGVALCFRSEDGAERFVVTGPYNKPAEAVNAAVRMQLRLAEMQDELE
jgi:hypothetical protein